MKFSSNTINLYDSKPVFASIQCEIKKEKRRKKKKRYVHGSRLCTGKTRLNDREKIGRFREKQREGQEGMETRQELEGQPRNLAITRYFNLLRPSLIDASPRVAQRRRMS